MGEELEGAALGQQHQQAVESLDQVGVVLHIQQLQAEIWKRTEEDGKAGKMRFISSSNSRFLPPPLIVLERL